MKSNWPLCDELKRWFWEHFSPPSSGFIIVITKKQIIQVSSYRITVESRSWLGTAVQSRWTVTQLGLSWLEACTFTITHCRGLLLGTRNHIEELDSIWNRLKLFCSTRIAAEIAAPMIQSEILTLPIAVSFDIKLINAALMWGANVRRNIPKASISLQQQIWLYQQRQ